MNSLTINLPIPDAKLRSNARVHWAIRSRLTKLHRNRAMLAARTVLGKEPPPRWEKASLRTEWFFPTRRHLDPDNAIGSLKAYIDGLADAGIVANDRGLWPERPVMSTDNVCPRVVLTVVPEEK